MLSFFSIKTLKNQKEFLVWDNGSPVVILSHNLDTHQMYLRDMMAACNLDIVRLYQVDTLVSYSLDIDLLNQQDMLVSGSLDIDLSFLEIEKHRFKENVKQLKKNEFFKQNIFYLEDMLVFHNLDTAL